MTKPLPLWSRNFEASSNTNPEVESALSAAAGIALTLGLEMEKHEAREWLDQGCESCRANWLQGRRDALKQVETLIDRHTTLWRCVACDAFWEENERFAAEMDRIDAEKIYGISLK